MNINKLKGKIVEEGLTQEKLAVKLGISVQALNAKLNNRSSLTIREAQMITEILNIHNPSEIFFSCSVPKVRQSKS
jgi:transcriptional regulator with XRE-family HTH domain